MSTILFQNLVLNQEVKWPYSLFCHCLWGDSLSLGKTSTYAVSEFLIEILSFVVLLI